MQGDEQGCRGMFMFEVVSFVGSLGALTLEVSRSQKNHPYLPNTAHKKPTTPECQP